MDSIQTTVLKFSKILFWLFIWTPPKHLIMNYRPLLLPLQWFGRNLLHLTAFGGNKLFRGWSPYFSEKRCQNCVHLLQLTTCWFSFFSPVFTCCIVFSAQKDIKQNIKKNLCRHIGGCRLQLQQRYPAFGAMKREHCCFAFSSMWLCCCTAGRLALPSSLYFSLSSACSSLTNTICWLPITVLCTLHRFTVCLWVFFVLLTL